jgi:hypothetical protein
MQRRRHKTVPLAGLALVAALAIGLLIHLLVHGAATPAGARATLPVHSLRLRSHFRSSAVRSPVQGLAAFSPPSTSGTATWIRLEAYAATPEALDIGVVGAGFAPRERIDLRVSGPGGKATASLQADGAGEVAGTVHLQIAPSATGPLHLITTGRQSQRTASATFSVVPYVPVLSLVPYATPPGGVIDVYGRGFAPHAAVRLTVDNTFLALTHTGADGSWQLHPGYTVPYSQRAGRLTLMATDELSKQSAVQHLDVLPLRPWATASAYRVHAGDHVQFDVHGFAIGEFVEAYSGSTYVGHSNGPTDKGGNAGGLGPFTVPSGSPRPTYIFVGARSGARTMVSLTMLL